MDVFLRIVLTLSAIAATYLAVLAGADLAARLGMGELAILFQVASVAGALFALDWLLDRSGLFLSDTDH
jgi:hypothetical protein